MAKLKFYHGIMSSGKTTDLIQTAYKYNSTGKKAIIVKPIIDTKGANTVENRAGWKLPADVLLKPDESIIDSLDILMKATCILVDEAQFLSPKQVQEFYYITKELNINVICYGLSKDFKGQLFPGSSALFQYSDVKDELMAVCSTPGCNHTARYNARKVNGEYVFDGPQVFIGADEAYNPLCASCYIKYVLRPKSSEFQDMESKFKSKVKTLRKEN